jgi:hypothetical protein
MIASRADAIWTARNVGIDPALFAAYDEACEAAQDIAEAAAEYEAEYRGEVARFGDAWPGAAIVVANATAHLRAANERAAVAAQAIRAAGGMTYGDAWILAEAEARAAVAADDDPF